jgi:DNA-binding response OmpR family regulator
MAHILVIEDDTQLRAMMATLLRLEGHVVCEAGDGNEGIACQLDYPSDLVITDIIMPERDGLETITAIGKMMPGTPIIAMSGAENHELYLRMTELLGARRTLRKPFSRPEFLAAVAEALVGSAKAQAISSR